MGAIPFRHRIGTRILAALLGVALTSISVSLILLSLQVGAFMRASISQRNLQIARQASGEIERYLVQSIDDLESLARLITPLPYTPWILSSLLSNTSLEFKRFAWVYLVDPDGSLIADGSLGLDANRRIVNGEALAGALSGRLYISPVRLSEIQIPYVILGISARLPDGRAGALVAELSLRDIWNLVDEISVGQRGFTYLVTTDGILVAHPDKVKIISQTREQVIPRPPEPVTAEGTVRAENAPGRGRVLTAYVRVADRDLIVAVQQPVDEAFLPAITLFQQSLVLVALGAGLAIWFGITFSRNISNPLVSLLKATDFIASGSMDHHITVKSRDEIGRLARSFNLMVERLGSRTRALQESEKKHRLVTERVNDIIFSLDEAGRITFASPRIGRISGYSPSEVIGRAFTELIDDADGRRRWTEFLAQTDGEEHADRELEVTMKTRAGKPVILEVGISREHHPQGDSLFYGVARDVTERKRLEERLLEAHRMEAVGRLAGGVAHDFNNILTAILGYCDLCLDQLEAGKSLRENLEEIRKAGTRAAAITRQLLAFSRKQILQPKMVDLNTVIESLVPMVSRLMGGEQVSLVTRLALNLWRINADPSQVEQVIMNLCLNSRDAMPQGGEIVIVTVNVPAQPTTGTENDNVRLTVSDNGTGMSEEVQAHAFEPFFTTKGLGKGTGLGLSTVYGIVRQSGGQIRFNSAPGLGTSFEILFPRAEGAQEEPPGPQTPRTLSGTETVLLVEDDQMIRTLVKETLEKAGYSVTAASGAEEALEIIRSGGVKIHLVITDLVLPRMSGRILAQQITHAMPGIAILYISGYVEGNMAGSVKKLTDAAFLQKPFSPAALLEKIRDIMEAKTGARKRPGRF
jgi:PAS domain S-box-containing protein